MSVNTITTEVSGRVIACNVQVGDVLAVGDEIAMIESMKLEIPIEAEQAGVVAQVLVAAGEDVEQGQSLVILA